MIPAPTAATTENQTPPGLKPLHRAKKIALNPLFVKGGIYPTRTIPLFEKEIQRRFETSTKHG
jgi:hypothetical protein